MSPAFHRGGLHFEQARGGFCDHRPLHGHATLALPTKHSGGFATIDPRHAGDTPQSSAYGSNSPKPPTKTSHTTTRNGQGCRTRPTLPPKEHATLALPSNHGGFCDHRPPTRRRHAGDTPQSSAYGSNSPQATNKNKPHHHNKHTKTSRTRPTLPHKGPTCAQTGHHSPINPTTTPHHDSSTDSELDHPGSTH